MQLYIVTPTTSDWKSSCLIIVISWTISQKKRLPSPTAKNHQGFQTPCFYRLLLFRLLWWLDNTWPGRCVYFVSAPGRDERQMMDGEWVKVRGGERQMSVRDVEKKNTVIKVMIHWAGHRVGCGKETDKSVPGRNVTNRKRDSHQS